MSDTVTGQRVAIIGLGNMGTPMSRQLLARDYSVTGFDLSETARAHLVEAGGQATASAVDAVREADVVIFMLPNSDIVESVIAEISDVITPEKLLIDMSSSEPMRTRALAASLGERGISFIDAPVSGGVKGAVAGTLTVMVGGEDDAVVRAEPVLESFGRVVRAGGPGAGHAAKALNNVVSAVHLWATSEAVIAGERFGIAPDVLLSIINTSSGRSGSSENKWPNYILPETYDSGFGLRLMIKDMAIAVGLSESVGVPPALTGSALALWSKVGEDYPADADHTHVAAWIREHARSDD